MKDLVVFTVNTGARESELLNLRWSQVGLERTPLIPENRYSLTKSKRVRMVPLDVTALEVLIDTKRDATSDFVFSLDGNALDQYFLVKQLKRYVKSAGPGTGLSFHSLRHTFASRLMMRDVSPYEVHRLLGHSGAAVTQIYTRPSSDPLSNAVEKLMDFSS